MKTIKKTLLLTLFLCFTFNVSQAQKMYNVHQDNVKPSKMMEYEKVAKEFQAACVEHKFQGQWLAVTMDDGRYLYVSPMENFAEMDKPLFAELGKAMGDKLTNLFERFDQCYDSHGNYVIELDEELTYMPEGISQTQEGEDYRDYFFIHYTPKNAKKIKEGMKAVKEMFAAKGSKSYYRIYKTGFGTMDSYYMVASSSKDAIDSATKHKANEEVLGPDRYETFNKVLNYSSKMYDVTGNIRHDLSYSPK